MILAGQGGKCRGYLREARADIGCHGLSAAAVVFVAGVGLGDREAEVALTGRERITNHAEYLWWDRGSARYSSGLVRTAG
jgi:hypothetical protein